MKPEQISIKDFSYQLPSERIAQFPLEERDTSKLLIYKNGKINEDRYFNLANYLPSESVLVFNDTKVVQARMYFQTSKGDKVEIFCLEPVNKNDIAIAMAACGSAQWRCFVGKVGKWKEKYVYLNSDILSIKAEIISRTVDTFLVEFNWNPETLSFAEVLQKAGLMPIPPYLRRTTEQIDIKRYQTVYAREEGSVAAPTAGLHFTKQLFKTLSLKNILPIYVTLHVGAGTFKPVKAEVMAEHEMHSEIIDVPISTIQKIASSIGKPIVAVGTTSLRTMETFYWLGVKILVSPEENVEILELKQWEPYSLANSNITNKDALEALIKWLEQKKTTRLICTTSLLIVPGYELKIADAIITNFHQPESTLMLLVATVLGEDWKSVYQYALDNEFRFLSYGDGSLLFANKK